MAKIQKNDQKVTELTMDLQRVRADFENYRKRVEAEKSAARGFGQREMVVKLLPIIDDIERATQHLPAELAENSWAKGVANLAKNLEKITENLGVKKILAQSGTPFNPDLHHAVQIDEESEGEKEVIAEELQAGYTLGDQVLRPAMVKVARK